jgi:uncharacterized protein
MDHPQLLEQLADPAAYPESTARVEVVQTHISTIFLTGGHAYKVKKPVDFGFLDYTTLERRRRFCAEEVRLNSRLAPDVYLGVVPIVVRDGRALVDGPGEAVEYAVKMVRLPEERMLRRVLARGEATAATVADIARRLAAFHDAAESGPRIADFKRLAGVKFNCDENFAQTQKYVGTVIPARAFARISTGTGLFLRRNAALFERRADSGRVRDGHGDMHVDSICVTDPVRIFDCIEFNERFRYADVAEEVAFLAMDLEYLGHDDLARAFVRAYVDASGDEELPRLLDFYKAYRAYVRGKVNAFQLDDPGLTPDARAASAANATRYFELALRYVEAFNPQRLFVTCGLTGSGKSVLARALGERWAVEVVRSDVVRKELLGLAPAERRHVPYGHGEYSSAMTDATYEEMVRRAETLLAAGHSVALDGCFIKREQRRVATTMAERSGVPYLLLECRTDDDVVRERLARRVAKGATVSDGRWEIYCGQRREFEPPDELPAAARVALDRSRPIDELIGVLDALAPPEWR